MHFLDLTMHLLVVEQISCTFIAYPSLLLAYIGQAAWLMKHEDMVSTTFYSSIPSECKNLPIFIKFLVVSTEDFY